MSAGPLSPLLAQASAFRVPPSRNTSLPGQVSVSNRFPGPRPQIAVSYSAAGRSSHVAEPANGPNPKGLPKGSTTGATKGPIPRDNRKPNPKGLPMGLPSPEATQGMAGGAGAGYWPQPQVTTKWTNARGYQGDPTPGATNGPNPKGLLARGCQALGERRPWGHY